MNKDSAKIPIENSPPFWSVTDASNCIANGINKSNF